MSAYVVFMREKTLDKTELEIYSSKAPASLNNRQVKVLAAYGSHVTLEGPDVEGIVIVEFPSLDEAHAWYESSAYQEAARHRFRGAAYRGYVVEGLR